MRFVEASACVIKTRERFTFLPLINNTVTIESRFLLLSVIAIISSKTINTSRFFFSCILQWFYKYHSLHSSIQLKLLKESLK